MTPPSQSFHQKLLPPRWVGRVESLSRLHLPETQNPVALLKLWMAVGLSGTVGLCTNMGSPYNSSRDKHLQGGAEHIKGSVAASLTTSALTRAYLTTSCVKLSSLKLDLKLQIMQFVNQPSHLICLSACFAKCYRGHFSSTHS